MTTVDVCVCTFKRSSVAQTLLSLADQANAPPFRIIVVDNDETPSAEGLVNGLRSERGLPIYYLHAPHGNISIARNACLDAASAPLIAFIDDDETAPADWLATLVAAIDKHDCDVVFGSVRATYPDGAPQWLRRGDFHSTALDLRDGQEVRSGYSGNVLFKRALVEHLRFDLALGRSGGEDTVFFEMLRRRGARLRFAASAVLQEPVPQNRLSLAWLLRRSFRAGQTHMRLVEIRGGNRIVTAALAVAKAGYCLLAAALTVWSPVGVRRNLIRGALHVGVVGRVLGAKDARLYGGA
ncbi:MAG: glycosyltransferase [Hyphomonadaceae bacterium]|nr:glycosyltransferase [Hyphomonadaceae bacterium]